MNVGFGSRLCENACAVLKSALLRKICQRLVNQQPGNLRRNAVFVPVLTVKPVLKRFHSAWVDLCRSRPRSVLVRSNANGWASLCNCLAVAPLCPIDASVFDFSQADQLQRAYQSTQTWIEGGELIRTGVAGSLQAYTQTASLSVSEPMAGFDFHTS